MRAVARQAVKRFAGMEPGRPVGGTYYLYRTLRNLDLDGVLERLMEARRASRPAASSPRSRSASSATSARSASTELKQEVEAEIRRRLVADRGVEAMARRCASRCPRTSTSCTPSREEMQ